MGSGGTNTNVGGIGVPTLGGCTAAPRHPVPHVFRPPDRRISPRFQFVLWFSGLRGAVAFVIAGVAGPGPRVPCGLPCGGGGSGTYETGG